MNDKELKVLKAAVNQIISDCMGMNFIKAYYKLEGTNKRKQSGYEYFDVLVNGITFTVFSILNGNGCMVSNAIKSDFFNGWFGVQMLTIDNKQEYFKQTHPQEVWS